MPGFKGLAVPGPSNMPFRIRQAMDIALAATWNTALVEQVGREVGRDARARGVHFLISPGTNIYRSPLNGRNFEYFGEDPWLASRVVVSFVVGVQSQGVAATAKHYVANDSEFARHTLDARIDERTLREIYLPPFEAAVREARVGTIMSSYNRLNGTYTSENEWLLTQVLVDDKPVAKNGGAVPIAGIVDLQQPASRLRLPPNTGGSNLISRR